MTLSLTDIVALFATIQLLFLAVVNFNYKRGKRLSSRILAGFMASNALLICQYLLSHFHLVSRDNWAPLYGIGSASYLLLMPFLYLYILSLCYNDFHLKKIHLLHVLPFTAVALFSILPSSIITDISGFESWVRRVITHIQILAYLVASVIVLVSYRKRLKDMYSSVEKIDLGWCNLILAAFAVMWSLDVLSWILSSAHVISGIGQHRMFFSSLLVNLAFTIAVTYRGLSQSASFSGIQEIPKYASSRLTPSDCDEIIEKLTTHMKTEKPYLIPTLSMDDLTLRLKIPAKNLSQAIHSRLNKNFYDFINSYRIEEVKELILAKGYQNQTFVALAYNAGFNSKSVFNAAFKRHTGLTPKQFKSQATASPNTTT